VRDFTRARQDLVADWSAPASLEAAMSANRL